MLASRSKDLVTLEEFIIKSQQKFPQATGELSQLLRDLALAGKIIADEINKTVVRNASNPEGITEEPLERMNRLEEFAETQLTFALKRSGIVCSVITDDDARPNTVDPDGKYIVILDPLDGTFNVEINASIGTIFSIYRRFSEPGTMPDESESLQPGLNQVASGYILYGSSVILVFTTKNLGVNLFTLDESLGEFFLAMPDIRVPEQGKTFSLNTSYFNGWDEGVKRYYAKLRGENLEDGKEGGYSYRYIGSFVADVHRTLLEGGIFLFPKSSYYPNGKLKLMYQCNPIALIVEQARGRASAIGKRILNITPEEIHQTTPITLGSVNNVLDAEKSLKESVKQ
ncbi:MAG: fructose-1,6-bisphosphatase [Balneolia bacterium]|nr:fructose-1,6-bisphosphatase [Balneolia bacterium]